MIAGCSKSDPRALFGIQPLLHFIVKGQLEDILAEAAEAANFEVEASFVDIDLIAWAEEQFGIVLSY